MTEASRRWRLLGASVCWILIAVANFGISDAQRWYPDLVAYMSLLCAACTALLALRPETSLAFRVGGTLAVGTLTLRVFSLFEGGLKSGDVDAVWIVLAQVGITVMLASTYARWWLTDVKWWHEAHKQIVRM